jgi:predicted NAD/FAD-binding protein
MSHCRTPQPFVLDEDDVLDYESGRTAGSELNRRRVEARRALEDAIKTRIEAETVYRKARATKRLEADASDAPGRKEQIDAWTADEWEAREKAQMAVDIWKERLEEIDGQRATLHRLLEWSMRLDPAAAEVQAQRMRPAA